MIAVLTPFVNMTRGQAQQINCAKNLRKISLGLHAYAADNKGAFPQNLTALYPNYVDDKNVFNCPASKIDGTPEKPDYKYTAGLNEDSPAKNIIVEDMEGNHGRSGKNVLRVGGSVDWQ